MKKTALGIVVVWPLFVLGQLSSLAAGDCVQKCPPRWRAPSPNLDDACHHQFNGTPFASCTCHRAYTSPHILGYGGMGCCYGYQKPCTICPWHFPGGMRCWAPAYCHDPAQCRDDGCPCWECWAEGDPSNWQIAYSGWESLGHIPNDSAAAKVESGAAPATGASSLLDSLRETLPLP